MPREAPGSGSQTVTELDLPIHLEGTLLPLTTQSVSGIRTSVSDERWPDFHSLWASISLFVE